MRETQDSETQGIAVQRFVRILSTIKTPEAVALKELLEADLIRLDTSSNAREAISQDQSGDLGFSVCLNPNEEVTGLLVLNENSFLTKGDFRLRGSIDEALVRFETARRVAEKLGMNWRRLEDDEVKTFLAEIGSGSGERHRTFRLD